MINKKTIGKRIKMARVEKDMRQIDLSIKSKVTQRMISQYENGKVFPTIYTLEKIRVALNKTFDYFLKDEVKKNSS